MKKPMIAAVAALAAMISSCSGSGGDSTGDADRPTQRGVENPTSACAQLADFRVDPDRITLPTLGARVLDARMTKSPVAQQDFCQVNGEIDAVDTTAPPIRFQVNLPVEWNGVSVQMGGGGYNGTLVTGLDNIPGTGETSPGSDAQVPAGAPLPPIDQGYVTYGSDGGTDVGTNPPGSFALNDTALANYAGESVKRTHDTAITVVQQFYGSGPDLQFHVGGSKGGHESLVAAQRYSDDYDGVVAYYPAAQNQAFVAGWSGMVDAAYDVPGNYLDPEHRQFVKDTVIDKCDDLDGLRDGLISDVRGCADTFDSSVLLCTNVASSPCLTPTQVAEIDFASEPQRLPYVMANGVDTVGPYPVLAGADLTVWMTTEDFSLYSGFVDGVQKYFLAQHGGPDPIEFDYADFEDRVEAFSREFDATTTDLDSFVDKGGKLILVQGDTDMLVPQQSTSNYYDSLVEAYGQDKLDESLRYYTVPGYGHGEGDFNLVWDSLGALQKWVVDGDAPTGQVARENGDRSRPLCEYPTWPKYTGSGPDTDASSFDCVTAP